MSNSLDPDQARRFVGPDLGPNCLPRLSADDTGRQRVKRMLHECQVLIDNSVLRVTVWHHEALPKGQICLSIPHTHDTFFFLHTFGCQRLN